MADIPTGAVMAVEPQVVTQTAQMLQQTVRYMSLSAQRIPIEVSVEPFQKHYEWNQKDFETGIDHAINVNQGTGATEELKKNEKVIPAIFFNKKLDFDTYREEQRSQYSLSQRLMDHMGEMALRMDIYNYTGDSYLNIDNLMTATPGTEFSTVFNVSTTALASTTTAAAAQQLKAALKYSNLIGPNSNIIMECTPSLFEELSVKSTNEDFSAYDAILRELNRYFPGGNHQVVENFLLDATIDIPEDTKQHAITLSTADKCIMYVQDPRIMKIVQSPLEVRQSPVVPTEGFVVQPVIRNRRIDVEPLGILIETGATVS